MEYLKQFAIYTGRSQKLIQSSAISQKAYAKWEPRFLERIKMVEALNTKFNLALSIDVALVFGKTPNIIFVPKFIDVMHKHQRFIWALQESGAYNTVFNRKHRPDHFQIKQDIEGWQTYLEAVKEEKTLLDKLNQHCI